jgi:hypothetical protein
LINHQCPNDAKKIWLVRNLPDVHIQASSRAHGTHRFREGLASVIETMGTVSDLFG